MDLELEGVHVLVTGICAQHLGIRVAQTLIIHRCQRRHRSGDRPSVPQSVIRPHAVRTTGDER